MSHRDDLKNTRLKIAELREKENAIYDAISRLRQPDPEVAEVAADVAVKLNTLGRMRALFARGQASGKDVDDAARLLVNAKAKAAKMGSCSDDGIAEAEAILREDLPSIHAEMQALIQTIPDLEYAVLREVTEAVIDEYDSKLREVCAAIDSVRVHCYALELLCDPASGRPNLLGSIFRDLTLRAPHFVGHKQRENTDLAGVFTYHGHYSTLNQKGEALRHKLLGE